MFDWDSEKRKCKRLPLIVIYDHPADFPNEVVARLWDSERPTEIYEKANSVDDLYAKLPLKGMIRLERLPSDDPVIFETWF